MKNCLIVFAKEPEEGKVKTRLRDVLTDSQCVELYKVFLERTLKIARSINCQRRILAYDSLDHPHYLSKIAGDFTFLRQEGDDLGMRMFNAFNIALGEGASKVIIIGSDSPTLPPEFIEKAFSALDNYDIVLGPTRDGGYYLIGLKETCLVPFKGVKWSSETVLNDTLNNIKRSDISYFLLDEWYDIDRPEDLNLLEEHIPGITG